MKPALAALAALLLAGPALAEPVEAGAGLGGGWKIAHGHSSVPFAMDGSFRALLDLKP